MNEQMVFIPKIVQWLYSPGMDVVEFYKEVSTWCWVIAIAVCIAAHWCYRRVKASPDTSVRRRKVFRWLSLLSWLLPLYMLFLFEESWIDASFAQACRTRAGMFVYQQVKVEGYADLTQVGGDKVVPFARVATPATPIDQYSSRNFEISKNAKWKEVFSESYHPEMAKNPMQFGGFKFREQITSQDHISHIGWRDGRWMETMLDKPSARYQLRFRWLNDIGYGLDGNHSYVIDTRTGKVVGENIRINRYGNFWARQTVGRFGDLRYSCGTDKRFESSPQIKNYYDTIQNQVFKH